MQRISKTTIAVAVAIAFAGAAQAQDANSSDSDNQSSYEHGQYGHSQSFQSSEHGQRASEKMSSMDSNRDQRIDENEAQSDPQLVAAWAEIDVTQDGAIDATEYYLYAAQQRIAELEQSQSQGQSARMSSEDAPSFDELDRDRGGEVSRAELSAVSEVEFSEADTNNDGSVSRAEYQAAVQNGQSRSSQRDEG